MEDEFDCTFLYFKSTGKWEYEGRGNFPRPPVAGEYYEVDHDAVYRQNNGMPGISTDGKYMTVIIIPDQKCTVLTAYPRMLKADKEV